MWYEATIAIPASTTKSSPKEVELIITYGIIQQVIIEAEPGCHREAGIRVFYHEFQVYPSNPDAWIELDAIPRIFNERQEIFRAPFQLKIKGYNDDANNQHEYKVGIGMLLPSAFPEYREEQGLIRKIARLLGVK